MCSFRYLLMVLSSTFKSTASLLMGLPRFLLIHLWSFFTKSRSDTSAARCGGCGPSWLERAPQCHLQRPHFPSLPHQTVFLLRKWWTSCSQGTWQSTLASLTLAGRHTRQSSSCPLSALWPKTKQTLVCSVVWYLEKAHKKFGLDSLQRRSRRKMTF